VIKIGIDLDRIEKVVSANGAEASGPKKILFVGLEREKKGAVDAVTAFCMARNRHPDIELHLVGDGSFRKRVRDILISRNALTERCFMETPVLRLT
jgi:glycosyltransferase involved in cell wall biosynthesis